MKAEKVSVSGARPRMVPWMREMKRPRTVAERSICRTRRARARAVSFGAILAGLCMSVFS